MALLHPKMLQRPDQFRLNPASPLYDGLVFAGLGGRGCVGSMVYPDASPYSNHGKLTNMDAATDWVWVPELGRWGNDYPGTLAAAKYTLLPMTGTHSSLTIAAIANIRAVTGIYEGIVFTRVGTVTGLSVLSASAIGYRWNNQYPDFAGPPPIIGSYALYAVSVATDKASLYVNNTSTINVAAHGPTSPTQFRIADDEANDGIEGRYLNAIICDVIIWSRALSPPEISALADPSNVDLRVGGVPLILPPRRRMWPVAVGASTVTASAHFGGVRSSIAASAKALASAASRWDGVASQVAVESAARVSAAKRFDGVRSEAAVESAALITGEMQHGGVDSEAAALAPVAVTAAARWDGVDSDAAALANVHVAGAMCWEGVGSEVSVLAFPQIDALYLYVDAADIYAAGAGAADIYAAGAGAADIYAAGADAGQIR